MPFHMWSHHETCLYPVGSCFVFPTPLACCWHTTRNWSYFAHNSSQWFYLKLWTVCIYSDRYPEGIQQRWTAAYFDFDSCPASWAGPARLIPRWCWFHPNLRPSYSLHSQRNTPWRTARYGTHLSHHPLPGSEDFCYILNLLLNAWYVDDGTLIYPSSMPLTSSSSFRLADPRLLSYMLFDKRYRLYAIFCYSRVGWCIWQAKQTLS